MARRAATCWLCAAATFLSMAGCGVPDQPRWDRSDIAPTNSESDRPVAQSGDTDVAVVELGPVVAAIEARGAVRVLDPVLVAADEPGRLEGRTTAAGDSVAEGDVVLEFSEVPDPADELRIEILELEREIADLEGNLDEVARLDLAIADAIAASNLATDDERAVVAPTGGVVSEYFVSVFDVVAAGDALFTIGDPANRAVVIDLDESMTESDDGDVPVVGSPVSLLDPRSSLSEPVAAVVTAIEVNDAVGGEGASGESRHIVIEVDSSSSFAVGDTVTVVFESTSAAESLRLAADAVRGSGDTRYVIVENAAGEWQRSDVRIGARTDRFVQVAESMPPLQAGDRVVLP